MISPVQIGFANTGVPLAILLIGALVLPRVLVDPKTLSHWDVIQSIAISSALLILLGAAILGVIYAAQGAEIAKAFGANWLGSSLFVLAQSAKAALFWAPVMALVWFALAQRVERNRGDEIARQDKS